MRQEAELAFQEAELEPAPGQGRPRGRRRRPAGRPRRPASRAPRRCRAPTQDLLSAQEDRGPGGPGPRRRPARAGAGPRSRTPRRSRTPSRTWPTHGAEHRMTPLQGRSPRRRRTYQQAVKDAAAAAAEANKGIKAHSAVAGRGSRPEVDAFAEAMRDLSPSQQEFVDRIIGMHDEYIEFRKQIAEPLFDRLLTAMDTVNIAGKDGKTIMDVLTTAWSAPPRRWVTPRSTPPSWPRTTRSRSRSADVMETNNKAIELRRRRVQPGRRLRPGRRRRQSAVWRTSPSGSRTVTEGWKEIGRAKQRAGELTETFKTAAERVKEFSALFEAALGRPEERGWRGQRRGQPLRVVHRRGEGQEGLHPDAHRQPEGLQQGVRQEGHDRGVRPGAAEPRRRREARSRTWSSTR